MFVKESRKPSSYNIDSEGLQSLTTATCSCLQTFHIKFSQLFYKLGHLIATSPGYFILVPIFITCVGLTGVQKMNYEIDPEKLFSPINGEGQMEREIVEKLFPVSYSEHFDPSRVIRFSNFARLIVSAKDNGTMFRTDVWDELIALDDAVRNLTIEWEGDTYNYTDICAKMNKECIKNQIFNLNDYMPEIENGSMLLNYPLNLFPLVYPLFLGGSVVNESEGVLTATKAVALNYWLRGDTWQQTKRSYLFEGKVLEFLDNVQFSFLKVSYGCARSFSEEIDKNMHSMNSSFFITVTLMILFSIGCTIVPDCVRIKIPLACVGILTALLGTVAAFGFLMYCGVPFIGINMAIPFLMIGIGLDDMFVLLSAWNRTKIQDDVPTRLAETYRESAVSITVTSLTNTLSFFVGITTPFLAVRIFCLYIGFSIMFTYIWFITLFGGSLAVAGNLEKKQRHAITCRPVVARSEAKNSSTWYRFWCTGGIDKRDPWNPEDNKIPVLMVFFRDYFGRALNIPAVKAAVIFMFVLYLVGAFYGCTQVKEGLERRKMIMASSYLSDYFDEDDHLFRDYVYRIQVVINESLTYSDPNTRESLLQLHKKFEDLKFIASGLFTDSWIRNFYKYLERRPHLKKNITDEGSFIRVLKDQFLGSSASKYLDIVFNEDETRIIASRFIIQGFNIRNTTEDVEMMTEVRRVAKEAPFRVTTYHSFFVFFDQLLLVRTISIQAICLAAVIMTLVALVFIPHPLCSLWVAFSIVSIEIGVIGYMSLWDVNVDTISMVNLIMCIGFSVDFSAHISYAYLTAQAYSPNDRVRECLYALGLPILQGGLSTVVGVLALAMAMSYVFTTFFKIVLLVILFGMMHGLLLLPVMLSLLGPGSCSKKESIIITHF